MNNRKSLLNMKKLSVLVLAAILGSLITLGAYKGLGFDQQNVTIQNTDATPSVFANLKNAPSSIPAARSASALPVDFTQAAAKSMPTVVHIKSTVATASRGRGYSQPRGGDFFDYFNDLFGDQGGGNGGEKQSSGSGVIISNDGYIVTNNHVVEGADQLEVTLFDNRSFPAQLVGTDPTTDLAVIKIDEKRLPTMKLGNSDNAKVGEWVLAVGNPFNLSSTVTAGIISAKGRNINILNNKYAIESFIQTDAAVNPGNSGGALVNVDGDLVGINTAIATRTGYYQGYSFAVPVNIVNKVVDDLINFGSTQRAYLGVEIRDLDSELASELGLNISQGVYVAGLVDVGAARTAGVQEGDVIVSVDGKSIKNAPELQEIIGQKRPGDSVNIKVNRRGKEKSISVPLKNQQGNTMRSTVASSGSSVLKKLGVEVADLSSNQLSRLDINGGVLVSDIMPGVISSETSMKEGFVVLRVNDKPVKSSREFVTSLSNKKGGVMIEGIYPGDPTLYYYAFGL